MGSGGSEVASLRASRESEHNLKEELGLGRPDRMQMVWVQRRRRGETVASIAKDEGVSPSWVSASTVAAGPFPRGEVVPDAVLGSWVKDRTGGWSIASIARRDRVDARVVRRATGPYGPFPRGRRVIDAADPIGMVELSRRLRVSDPTVWRWFRLGLLPDPDMWTVAGRPRWEPSTVDRWRAESGWPTCRQCGATVRSLVRHSGAVHST